MDIETSEAIEGLSNQIDGLRRDVHGLRGEVYELRGEIQRVAECAEDNRRHADIQVESIRDDIRIVASGVATLALKLDRH